MLLASCSLWANAALIDDMSIMLTYSQPNRNMGAHVSIPDIMLTRLSMLAYGVLLAYVIMLAYSQLNVNMGANVSLPDIMLTRLLMLASGEMLA